MPKSPAPWPDHVLVQGMHFGANENHGSKGQHQADSLILLALVDLQYLNYGCLLFRPFSHDG